MNRKCVVDVCLCICQWVFGIAVYLTFSFTWITHALKVNDADFVKERPASLYVRDWYLCMWIAYLLKPVIISPGTVFINFECVYIWKRCSMALDTKSTFNYTFSLLKYIKRESFWAGTKTKTDSGYKSSNNSAPIMRSLAGNTNLFIYSRLGSWFNKNWQKPLFFENKFKGVVITVKFRFSSRWKDEKAKIHEQGKQKSQFIEKDNNEWKKKTNNLAKEREN